jgi:hypothetical protein
MFLVAIINFISTILNIFPFIEELSRIPQWRDQQHHRGGWRSDNTPDLYVGCVSEQSA